MNKDMFTKIQAILETRIIKCEQFLYGINTTEDLKKLTVGQAQALQRFCKEEEALMSRMVQTDLYHIIGMGNLTPPQMMKFTYLIKEYLQYRGTIKTLASNFEKISALPGLPVSAAYKLHCFDGIVLTSSPEALQAATSANVPYAISGNLIQVLAQDLPRFLTFWSEKAKVSFSENHFVQKLKSGSDYGGVRWTVDNSGNYVGVIKQDSTQQLFEGCAKSAQ